MTNAVIRRLDPLITSRRIKIYPVFLLLLMIGISLYPVFTGHPPYNSYHEPDGGDYTAMVTGGGIVLKGMSRLLYDVNTQWRVQRSFLGPNARPYLVPFDMPPPSALLFVPYATLPYLVGAAFWAVTSALMIAASIRLVWPLLPNVRRFGFGRVLLISFSTMPAIRLLNGGQDSAVVLLVLAAGLRLLSKRRDSAAGAVLALGVFKPQLILLAPLLLLLQRRWRALGAFIAVTGALAVLAVVLVGPAGLSDFLAALRREATHSSSALGENVISYRMFTLFGVDALVRGLLPSPLSLLLTVVIAGAGGALLLWWARVALRPASDGSRFCLQFAGMIVVQVLVNPHLLDYDAVILLIPALVLLDHARTSPGLRVLLAAVYVLSWTYALLVQPMLDHAAILLPLAESVVVLAVFGMFVAAQRLIRAGDPTQPAPKAAVT